MLEPEALARTGEFLAAIAAGKLDKTQMRLAIAVCLETLTKAKPATAASFEQLGDLVGLRKDKAKPAFLALVELGYVQWDDSAGVAAPRLGNLDLGAGPAEPETKPAPDAASSSGAGSMWNQGGFFKATAMKAIAGDPLPAPPDPTSPNQGGNPLPTSGSGELPTSGSGDPLSIKASLLPEVGSKTAIAKLQLCTKAKAKLRRPPEASTPDLVQTAWIELERVDRCQARYQDRFSRQWRQACQAYPRTILDLVRKHQDKIEARLPGGEFRIANPWAWLARKAHDWGILA